MPAGPGAAACGCRGLWVAVLAYVDAVAVPSVNVEYLSPAYPFLLLFAVLAPASFLHALRRRV